MIFLIFAISAVSAQSDELNSTEIPLDDDLIAQSVEIAEDNNLLTEEAEIEEIKSADDEIELKNGDEEILDASDDDILSAPGSFSTLDNTIRFSGSKLTLNNDYRCSANENDVIIYLKNNFVLEGNGHVLDYNNQNARLVIYSSNVTINNVTFINAGYNALSWSMNGGKLTNCKFISNNGYQGSGLILYGSNVLVENVSFINNTASYIAGAAAVVGSNNVFNNVTFINNSAPNAGAVAQGFGAGTGNKIKNSKFINNTATQGLAGGIYNQGDDVEIENTIFDGNTARAGSGGGIYFIHSDNAFINNCSIINNYGHYAGGFYLNGINNTINDTLIENNRAYSGAGGFLLGESSHIENSTFKDNSAVYGGGGLSSMADDSSSIVNSEFINNKAGNYGGGLSIWNTLVDNCTFKDNTAIYGGGVFTVNSTVKDSTFINNNAPYARSIFAVDDFVLQSDVPEDEIIKKHDNYVVNTQEEQFGFFIALDNGYYGFCVEKNNSPPYHAVQTENMTIIRNSLNHEDVHEYIKILFYVFVDHLDDIEKNTIQELVWIFTNDEFRQSDDERIQKSIELYDEGFRVPNHNATKILKNGTLMVYDFACLVTPSSEQNMFIFKFEYRNITNQTVEKKALNKTVFVGDEFRYEITVRNTGDEILNDVFIEDVNFSSNMEFVKAINGTGEWKYSNETFEVFKFNITNLVKSEYRNITSRWILTTPLNPDGNASIILIFRALQNGTAVNNVTSGSEMLELSNTTNNETKIYNPNMTVEKITITPTVTQGSLTTFKIIVTNTGDLDLTDVFVVESDYAGLEYDSFEGKNWTKTGNRFTYLNTLEVGSNATFNITFKALTAGNFTNIVVAGSNETKNKTTNNTTKVLKPNLDVYKITLTPVVKIGEKAVFKIVVTNTGEVDLENVFVIEDFDKKLTYLNYECENASWNHSINNENKHQFTLNNLLKVGESSSFNVIFNTTAVGNFSNTVTCGYNNTNITNSTNTTEVVNETTPKNKTTPENKTNPKNKTTPKDKPTPKEKKTPVKKQKVQKEKVTSTKKSDKILNEKIGTNATGNPLIMLLMSLAIIPLRRFRN